MRRVMLIEADRRWPHPYAARLSQRSADENLRHHDVLVLHRVVFADPEIAEPQLLRANDQLKILVVALSQRLGRIVKRHDEHAVANGVRLVVHLGPSCAGGHASTGEADTLRGARPLRYEKEGPADWLGCRGRDYDRDTEDTGR